jgi:ABC-type Mn2+/Zn2+ transport system permease subunit
MGHLATAGAGLIAVGILLLLFMLSESQDCTFENVNIICGSGANISEKALFVIASVFFIVLGVILFQKDKEME